MKTIIQHIGFIALLLFSYYSKAQSCSSFKTTAANWTSSGSWSCSGGAASYPKDANATTGWNGTQIIIESGTNIVVPNNTIITFTKSSPITIIVKGTLDFRANPQIILPAGSKIIIDGGQLLANNNSNNTLITIGGNGVWGKGSPADCGSNVDLTVNGTIDQTTKCPTNASLILPVKFIDFYTQLNNNTIQLVWSTAQEINNSHFVVQESFDGKNFTDKGIVMGAGNSHIIQNYSFSLPFNNQTTYYRLKQVDIDGQFDYSKIIVETYQLGDFVLYPNPSTQNVHCTLTAFDGNTLISISNELGDIISNQTYNTSITNEIDFSITNKGIYFVKVVQGNQVNVQKLIIH